MIRAILAIVFAAVFFVPQFSEAQLFRGGFRGRGIRDQAPRPRLRIFQGARNNGLSRGNVNRAQSAPNRPINAQTNSLISPNGFAASGSSVLIRRGLGSNLGTQVESGANNLIGPASFQDSDAENRGVSRIESIAPGARPTKAVFSILEIPAESNSTVPGLTPDAIELEPVIESNSEPNSTLESETTSSLDIVTPPLEPVEIMPANSILQIVPPKKSGR